MSDQPTIRFATREDVPTILALIIELAEYENAVEEVKATEASLASTLSFAPSPGASDSQPTATPGYAKTLLLIAPDGVVAGMALHFYNYSTWTSKPGIYLEDLFVRPQYRGKGYGKALIRGLAKELQRLGGARLEWSCLRWNEPSLKFYKSIGAITMDGWVTLRLHGEALEKFANAGSETGN